jgi:iron-sulfur cluster repair protein YtfE (RIC family)
MTPTLPTVAHAHHALLLGTIDAMPGLADRLLSDADGAAKPLAELTTFLTDTLIPHMEVAEHTLYPVLERLFQNRHSMSPMRREHDDVRRLIASVVDLSAGFDAAQHTVGRTLALRRVLFRLYALLKIHLAEEEVYLRIVDRGMTDEAGAVLAAALEHPGYVDR